MLQNHIVQDQSEVTQFLDHPENYPCHPQSVERKETHGAIIFMAGDDVYKIKKAVKFSYMDFSTPELREAVCRNEVDINSRTAPDIYLGVVPVTREEDGALALGGKGSPVEWAVHMRRFREENVLSSLAATDRITDEIINQLARTITEYHSSARTSHHADGVKIISDLIDDLHNAYSEADDIFSGRGDRFAEKARTLLESVRSCLVDRAEHGCIRRCHGDMHLGNIVLIDETPVLFDAIEFNEKIATIDIFYDLAFLLMDLVQRGLKSTANLTLNRYLHHAWTAPNLEGLKAMPLFLACRAGVRAMVHAQQAAQKQCADRVRLADRANAYLQSALRYLETTPPGLVAVGGLSGTGKSSLAASLAPSIGNAPGALHLRSDIERKTMFELEETTRLPVTLYSPEINNRVYNVLLRKAETVLKAGHSVIVDAVFHEEEQRLAFEQLARALNVSFTGIWLTAPEETLISRVEHRTGDASDADGHVVRQQVASETGAITWKQVFAGGSRTDTVIEASAALGL